MIGMGVPLFSSVDGGGGGGTTGTYISTPDRTANSSSAFASKGTILTAFSNLQFSSVLAKLWEVNPFNYRCDVGLLNSSNEITSILSRSAVVSTVNGSGNYTFNHAAPINIPNGSRFVLLFVRLGGTPTSICKVSFPAGGDSNVQVGYYGCARYASNNPQVGDSIFFSQVDVVHCEFDYTY